jgi:dihydropteroate synthase
MTAAEPASLLSMTHPNPPSARTERWRVRGRVLVLDRPFVMGIVNVTPDSFSDGGRLTSAADAVAHAERLVAEGADVVDIGGESTRPGATPVSAAEERQRVAPVIAELRRRHHELVISVDTVKSDTARAALDAGADIVNDVSAFRLDAGMGAAAAEAGAGVILMHSRGDVSDMARFDHARYDDVVADVGAELAERLDAARAAGVPDECVALDPGIGFAKRAEHSLALLDGLPALLALGRPLVIGVSRKRFIGELTGVTDPARRVHGTTGANVAALARGARVFRVHDVRAAREALDVAWAVFSRGGA